MSLVETARGVIERLPLGNLALSTYRGSLRLVRKGSVRLQKLVFAPDPENLKINVGGGNWYRRYWQNLDLYAAPEYIDYRLDMREGERFPLRDASVALIFTSHCLEHLHDDQAQQALNEMHRVLKPSGTLRISVPDMEKAFEAYRGGDWEFFDCNEVSLVGETFERRLVNYFASYKKDGYGGGPPVSADEVAEKLRLLDAHPFVAWCVSLIPHDAPYMAHVNGYDFEKLAGMLRKSGFINIVKSGYRQSAVAEMTQDGFDNRPQVSLFVEAQK